EEDEARRDGFLAEHVGSIKTHISGLGKKNYPDVEELNALDFVLMFVPIETALIAALQSDPTLPEYALKHRVALLSPANFLATVRTVASIWQVHKQNTNARDIAERAGRLYDKFVGFTENLKTVGMRLDQAKKSFDDAYGQLSSGSGNLVGHVDKLSKLGARHAKQLDAGLVEKAIGDDAHLRLVKDDEDSE
ncbi:MAG: DNA recombination protein RmuC, partial [Xanthomonadales bacterium]|nr:DNA recombination protein RmuC [Xanthomonadales bacterium]